ncbi:hypothetical protein MtrunA17_Chr7g0264481 [Medicago truncatula]|uniref:Uncharacterized protein n=1 Tax=Medicago truncatula TaxID=3880 RepID=A0A396H9N1_MEDTR|nr:hypothetical protein MtrunA17_Chr7g0264481 [Medicago truncatula]
MLLAIANYIFAAHYIRHKEIKGVNAVKILAKGLEDAIAGTDLQVLKRGDDSIDIISLEQESKDDSEDNILKEILEAMKAEL